MGKAKARKAKAAGPGTRKPAVAPAPPPSIRAVASACGVSRSVIDRGVEVGELQAADFPVDSRGRRTVRDFDSAVKAVKAHLVNPPKLGRPPLEAETLELPAGFNYEDVDTWPRDLAGLRLVTEYWRARKAKRDDDSAAGELLRADEVRREIFAAARTVRDHLLRLPESAAHDVAAELGVTDAVCVRRVMLEAIERALTGLSSSLQVSES